MLFSTDFGDVIREMLYIFILEGENIQRERMTNSILTGANLVSVIV